MGNRSARESGVALILSFIMVMSMVAIGGIAMSPAGATVDGPTMDEDGLTDEFEEELTEDIELQTQSGDEVTVTEELEAELEEVDSDETVEVFVRLDEAESELLEGETLTTDSDGESLDTDDPQVTAELTQMPLKEYAAETDGVEVLNEFWIANGVLLEVEESLVDDLTTIDGVDELHPNYEIEHPDPEPAAVEHSEDDTADMHYTYGLEQLNVPDAWDEFGTKGEDVQIAIVDTGINADHEAFPHYNESNWAAFGFDGTPLHEEEPAEFGEPFDFNGHGTHVAGTAAGNTSATDQPAIGVAPEADILAINVFPDPDGGTTLAAIVAGMQHAVEEGTDVSNFSLGGDGFGDIYVEVIQNAKAKGTHVVSSSGNDGPGATGTPANVYNSTAVGATNYLEAVAGFSTGAEIDTDEDWGPIAPDTWPDEYVTPDVSAPGVAVLSAYVPGEDAYDELSGTSMAAPHVTGVTALLMSHDDSLQPNDVKETLEETSTKPTPDQISQEVLWDAEEVSPETATDLHFDDERDARYGYGIVDAYSALASVDGQTIDGKILNVAGDPVQDRGYPAYRAAEDDEFPDPAYPGFVPDGSGPTVTIDDTDRHSYAVDSTFDFDVTDGSYELNVTGAFGHADKDFEVDAGEEPDVILDRKFEVEPVSQPPTALSDDEFNIETNVAHLENITVSINETLASSSADADNVTVGIRGLADDISLGEKVELDEFEDVETPVTGYPAAITITANDNVTSGDLALDKTLEGIGETETLTTETTILAEEPEEPAQVTFGENTIPDTVFPLDPLTPNGDIEIVNPDAETPQSATVIWEAQPFGMLDIEEFELDPDETETWDDIAQDFAEDGFTIYPNYVPGETIQHSFTILETGETEAFETVVEGGLVSGTVTDIETEEPLPGIELTLVDSEGQVVDSMVTDGSGDYRLVAFAPGEHTVIAEAPDFGPTSETIEFDDELNPITEDIEIGTQPTFQFDFEAGETYSFGIPGPIEGETLGEILPSEMEGVVYTHDAGENEWVQVGTDYEVEPREAFVIVADDDQEKVTVDFAGIPGASDVHEPAEAVDLEEGWNLVSPVQFGDQSDAFPWYSDLVTDPGVEEPVSTMIPETGDNEFNPFAGYWVAADDDNDSVVTTLGEDMTLDRAYDELNIDYERLSGNVVSNVDGEGVVDADLSVGGTPFQVNTAGASMAGDVDIVTEDGAYSLPPLPTEQYNIVSADADGFEATTFNTSWDEPDLDDEIELEEKVYFNVTDLSVDTDEPVAAGDSLDVEYTLENEGNQTGTVIVDTAIGDDLKEDPAAARLRHDAYGLHSTQIELDSDERTTVEFESEVPDIMSGGELQLGVTTDRDEAYETLAVDVDANLSFSEQATSSSTYHLENETQSGVVVEDVDSNVHSAVVVTYEDDETYRLAGDEIRSGYELDGTDLVVELDESGFPGEHTAHVIPVDKVSEETLDWNLSEETRSAAEVSDETTIFQGMVEFEDQELDGPVQNVTVAQADLLDGMDNDTLFVLDLHEDWHDGPFVGSSEVLSGTNENVTVEMADTDGDEIALSEASDYIAMVHLVDNESVEEGDWYPPGTFSPLPNTEWAYGDLPGGVTDAAYLDIDTPVDALNVEFEADQVAENNNRNELTAAVQDAVGNSMSDVNISLEITQGDGEFEAWVDGERNRYDEVTVQTNREGELSGVLYRQGDDDNVSDEIEVRATAIDDNVTENATYEIASAPESELDAEFVGDGTTTEEGLEINHTVTEVDYPIDISQVGLGIFEDTNVSSSGATEESSDIVNETVFIGGDSVDVDDSRLHGNDTIIFYLNTTVTLSENGTIVYETQDDLVTIEDQSEGTVTIRSSFYDINGNGFGDFDDLAYDTTGDDSEVTSDD